ncbi:MAG: hypothetical protein JXR75_08920 [Rhodobacteraceae bacterium]|nr:hypothetical protein [Paracoccaceae bacterium]
MTDKIALSLGVVVVVAILADILGNGGQAMLFLLTKLDFLLEWLAFWR